MATVDVFDQIIKREIPADIEYEDDSIIAFRDINPKATLHILIVPKRSDIVTALDIKSEHAESIVRMYLVANEIAKQKGLKGYKLHMNVGEEGGQIVPHLHLHMLSADYDSLI